MTPIELLKRELEQAEKARDLAEQDDRYARSAHFNAQEKFSKAKEKVTKLRKAIEILEAAGDL